MGVMDSWLGAAKTGAGVGYYVGIGVIVVGLIVVLVLFILLRLKYNKHIYIHQKVSMGYILREDVCREIVDKDGNKWWVRWNESDKLLKNISEPPSTAIIPDKKGKLHAVVKLIDGHYFWVDIKDDVAAIPQSIYEEVKRHCADIKDLNKRAQEEARYKALKIKEWKELNNYQITFHPFTSNQRAILVNAVRRAEERKQQGWQTQLPMIVGVGAAVLILIALLVFYGNIAKPVLEMADKQLAYENVQKEQLQIIQQIKNDIQVIKEDTKKGAGD